MGEASSRLGLYSGNQREAILDLREQQLFVRAQGLCRALRSPLRFGDKNTPVGAAAAPAQEGGGVQAVGPAASRVKSKLSSTVAGHLLCAGCTDSCFFDERWAPFCRRGGGGSERWWLHCGSLG